MKIQIVEQKIHGTSINQPKVFRLTAEHNGREIISPAVVTLGNDKEMVLFMKRFNTLVTNVESERLDIFNCISDQKFIAEQKVSELQDTVNRLQNKLEGYK